MRKKLLVLYIKKFIFTELLLMPINMLLLLNSRKNNSCDCICLLHSA